MKKIVSIVGARPQFIKLAPLSKKIRKIFNEIIIHTGQHFDNEMSELFFQDLDISQPDYNLGINGGNHGEQTGKMLEGIEKILLDEKPDLVLVFGDTNSTIAGALAAVKLKIKVAHIEAGLRSFNKQMPEEINRILTDHISDFLFAPTKIAFDNLKKEGLKSKTFLSGDIMVDSLSYAKKKLKKNYQFKQAKYYLLTLHRPYNVDNPAKLKKILDNLSKLNHEVIFPIHPRTKNILESNKINIPSNFKVVKPVGYLEFIKLQINAEKIITDSGGIQKEAYILKKPCITLRTETEWVETVKYGWNLLLDIDCDKDIYKKIERFKTPKNQPNLFGKNPTEKVLKILKSV